jgi:hypothetical protein
MKRSRLQLSVISENINDELLKLRDREYRLDILRKFWRVCTTETIIS